MDRFGHKFARIRKLSDQDFYRKQNRNPMERTHTEIKAKVNKIANSLPTEFAVFKNEVRDLQNFMDSIKYTKKTP